MRLAVVLLGCFLALTAGSALAEKRVGLVLGNNLYRNLSAREQLTNPVSDAREIKAALESLDFRVDIGENLDRNAMIDKISDFAARLEKDDIAFFFFSGHGVSFSGANYILPSDIPAPRSGGRDEEGRLADLAIPETRVIERIQKSGARIAVVALDACRDNPLAVSGGKSVGGDKGLSAPQLARGILSIYSASAGQKARDDLGDGNPNSPFTRVFVKHLRTAGLGLRDMAFRTQGEVASLASASGYDQVPGVYSQIIGEDVFLAGRAAAASVADTAQADFATASLLGTVAGWDGFLAAHGTGALADYARGQRDRLTAPPPKVAVVVPPPPVATGPCGGVVLAGLVSRAAGALSRNEECALKRGDEFRECRDCPPMVVLPPGSFTMGSPAGEEGRYDNEGPQHVVGFARGFAVGKFQVTRDEFAAFVKDSGYDAGSKCYAWSGTEWKETAERSWKNPGYEQTGSHPASCLNWNDASAYAVWLSKKTGADYRLLSEAEWEYAARGQTSPGNYPRYFSGDSESDFCRYGNGFDATAKAKVPGFSGFAALPCDDKYAYTSPVGRFSANAFGLFDMHGNVWQWTQDCWNEKYDGAPADGGPWTTGDCSRRVLRGGCWNSDPGALRAANRGRGNPADRNIYGGLRVARTLLP